MSIMRDKPIYCNENFEAPDVHFEGGILNMKIDDFLKLMPLFDIIKGSGTITGDIIGNNHRFYSLNMWNLFDPFRHPRYKLFQPVNPINDLVRLV